MPEKLLFKKPDILNTHHLVPSQVSRPHSGVVTILIAGNDFPISVLISSLLSRVSLHKLSRFDQLAGWMLLILPIQLEETAP